MFDTNAISEAAQERALRRAGERIKGIDRTTREGVRGRIKEAIDQGMSPREAGQHVAAWSGWDEYRAERIARTETMFAYNSAATTTYSQFGVTHVVADDGDKDEQCAARHGMVVTVEEAEDILDHPNGTLDWLPVAPGYDARQIQEELAGVRAVAQAQFGEPQQMPEQPAPAVPTSPPKTAQARAVHDFEQRVATEKDALTPNVGRVVNDEIVTYGNEVGRLVGPDGAVKWESTGGAASIDMAAPEVRKVVSPGDVITHFHPTSGAPELSAADVRYAVENKVTIRAFHATGDYQEFAPVENAIWGSPHASFTFDQDVAAWKNAHPGASWNEAYNETMREWTQGQGTFRTGNIFNEGQV